MIQFARERCSDAGHGEVLLYIVQSAYAVLAEANGIGEVAFVCIVHIVLLKGQDWVRKKFAVLSFK